MEEAEMKDMSVLIAGVRFKTPLVVSSSECGSDLAFVEKLSRTPLGGLVTKTFTSKPEHRIRVRPYQFPLDHMGKGYRGGHCLYSMAAPHVEDLSTWLKKMATMAELCRRQSIVLIGSFFENPEIPEMWAERGFDFESAGADMLELNFSCPHTSGIFAHTPRLAEKVISAVKKRVSIPVGLKIGPTLEPLEYLTSLWEKIGLDFLTAHNAPSGLVIDVEEEAPFGAPSLGGYAMGRAFLPYSLARLVRIKKTTRIPLIGVGGVGETVDVLQYLLGGASLVGLGSALYFEGPRILEEIVKGLLVWMNQKGYRSIREFQGKVLPMIQNPTELAAKEKYPFSVPPHCPYVPDIDQTRCIRCGICEETCIYSAFSLDAIKDEMTIEQDKCWSCGFCVGICPKGAIELKDRSDLRRTIWNNIGTAKSFT